MDTVIFILTGSAAFIAALAGLYGVRLLRNPERTVTRLADAMGW